MALACSVCGSIRSSTEGRESSWNCLACTYANTELDAPVCAVCGTSRQRSATKPVKRKQLSKRENTVEPDQSAKRPKAGDAQEGGLSTSEPTDNFLTQRLRMQASLPTSSSRSPPDNGIIPRCEVGDATRMRAALRDVGVVLLRNVAKCEELAHAERLFFDWLEDLPLGIRVSKPRNMKSAIWQKLGYSNTGVIANYSIGQSEFMWYLRLLPRVRQVFADAWGLAPQNGDLNKDHRLISSFDGCGAQRNIFLPEAERDWRTGGRWFHLDQNHRMHPGLHAYQGVLNFYPSDASSGSTVVVPGSHHHFRQICEAHPQARGGFVKLAADRDPGQKLVAAAVQVIMDPGDLLLWDSRIVHCNQGLCPLRCHSTEDTAALAGRTDAAFARLVAYIAMLPTSRLSPKLAAERRSCVREGRGTGHDASYVPRGGKRVHVHPTFHEPSASHPLWQLVDPGYS